MKITYPALSTISKRILYFVLFLLLLLLAWAAYINNYGDEEPDSGRDAFYARSEVKFQDIQNLAVAISGINAPKESDMIAHGRFVLNTYYKAQDSDTAKAIIANQNELKFIGESTEFDCWINNKVDIKNNNCASPARIESLLLSNKVLLTRYKNLYDIMYFQGSSKNGMTVVKVNELLLAEIKLDISNNKPEIAYQKWHANHQFVSHVLSQPLELVDRMVYLVVYGYSLNTLEQLLFKAPQISTTHFDELQLMLKPRSLSWFKIKDLLSAEFHQDNNMFINKQLANTELHPNYIRNRIYRAHIDLLNEAQKIPFDYEKSENILYQKYHFGPARLHTLDWLDPLNSLLSKVSVRNSINCLSMFENIHSKNALSKLLNLSIQIRQKNIFEAAIQTFLNNAGSDYNNPFTNKPMLWDAKNKVIYFKEPSSEGRKVAVRL